MVICKQCFNQEIMLGRSSLIFAGNKLSYIFMRNQKTGVPVLIDFQRKISLLLTVANWVFFLYSVSATFSALHHYLHEKRIDWVFTDVATIVSFWQSKFKIRKIQLGNV